MAFAPGKRMPRHVAGEIAAKLTSSPNRQLLDTRDIRVHIRDAILLPKGERRRDSGRVFALMGFGSRLLGAVRERVAQHDRFQQARRRFHLRDQVLVEAGVHDVTNALRAAQEE